MILKIYAKYFYTKLTYQYWKISKNSKQKKRYIALMDRKSQYYKYDSSVKIKW